MRPHLLSFLLLATALALPSSAKADILIDDFSSGSIPFAASPGQVDEAGLSDVIGSGDRRSLWILSSGGDHVYLDLNDGTPGSALLTSDTTALGLWVFIYGHNSPMDIDLSNASTLTATFVAGSGGTFGVTLIDTSDNFASHSVPFSLPTGGTATIDFSDLVGNDLQHVKEVILSINGSESGNYILAEANIQEEAVVPEPGTLGLLGLGLAALFGYHQLRRVP